MTTTPADDAASILGPITPIHCPLTGCHWSCHGVPDKYADSRARIVREHLAAEHAPEDAEHALATARRVVGETTTDTGAQADGLRDRIRRAICEASGFTWLPDELLEPDEYGEHADAVLAVLPAPADRAAILRERAEFFEGCIRNAADPGSDPRYWSAIHDVAMGLRRLADEAQQPTDAEELTEEQIVREHVTTVHLIGEQLAAVESWLWERLADVRDAKQQPAPAVTEEPTP
jgi:hypothetical protein